MGIRITPVECNGKACLGLEAAWTGSQFVMIVAEKGLVSCGVVDMDVMGNAGAAIAVSRGKPENPLVTTEDLLNAPIMDVTPQAAALGILVGMSGREALERLCN